VRRGLPAALLVLAAAFGLPGASAAAQEPAPGSTGAQRRAEARALGDVALSVQTELEKLQPDIVEASGGSFDRKTLRCVNRAIDDLEETQISEDVAESLGFVLLIGVLPAEARVVAPPLRRASERLSAVSTGDRILQDGVKAWLATSDFYGRLASVRATPCSVLTPWRHDGFKLSKAPRELLAFARLLEAETDPLDRLGRAERRLLQLGVKSRAAEAFGETLDELVATDLFAEPSTEVSSTLGITDLGTSAIYGSAGGS